MKSNDVKFLTNFKLARFVTFDSITNANLGVNAFQI